VTRRPPFATDVPRPTPAPVPPRMPRSGRWRRWLLVAVLVLVALRIALAIALPPVARSALEGAGLRADWDSLSLSLLGGSVEVDGLEVAPAGDAASGGESARLGVARANVSVLRLLGLDVVIDELALSGLRITVHRTAAGELIVSGLPQVAARKEPAAEAPAEAPAEPPPAEDAGDSAPPLIAINHIALTDLVVEWRDDSRKPAVASTLHLDLTADGLQWGPGAEEGRFELVLSSPGELDRLALSGTLRGDPDDLSLVAHLELRGLQDGPLADALPPGITNELRAGQLDATLAASWSAGERGGRAARLELSGFDLREAGGEPLLAFESLRLEAPRLDAETGDCEVKELSLAGLRGRLRFDASGTLHALGLALGAAAAQEEPAADTASPATAATAAAPAAPVTPAAAALPERSRVPLVTLERLDLELAELTIVDERAPGAAPLVLRLRLQNSEPLRLIDAVPEELPPCKLHLAGSVRPLADRVLVDLEVAPWQSPATVLVSVDLGGLRGEGLTELRPDLAATLDGSGLRDGRFTAALRAEIDARRRGPARYDWSQGFGVRVQLDELALRDAPEGQVLMGLKGLELDAPRIDAAGGLVHVRSLDLDTPQLALRRDSRGLHVAGLLLRAPPPAAEATTSSPPAEPAAPTADAAVAADPAEESDVAPAEPAAPGTELRVDRFTVHGLALDCRDETTTPPTALVLDTLEVDVRQFSTRAFVEPRSMRFNVLVGAAPIELPRRTQSSSLLAGLATAAGEAVMGEEERPPTELRPAFTELTISGTLRLAPTPKGHVRLRLSGFELLSLAGPAAASEVEIGDGLLDTTIDMRLRGEQGVEVDSRLVFTDLSLAEPADGPISTYLKLPAPLDSVLFMLRNERGEHRIAFDVAAPPEGVGGGQLLAASGEAMGAVIGRAFAAVPMRMLTSVTDLAGVTSELDEWHPEPELAVEFAPGSSALPDVTVTALRDALTRLRAHDGAVLELEHRLGAADLERAEQLGNPSPEQCASRGAQLRRQRTELLRRQAECSAEARAMLLVGREDEAEAARARLIEAERQLCLTEVALDDAYDRLRPGAERYRDQRTRAAALQIGEARLQALLRALLALHLPAVAERIELRPPRLEPIQGEGGGVVTATLKGG
jgi:hypothetical protein